MKKIIYLMPLSLITFIFVGCITDPYIVGYKPEKMVFVNQTDSTIYVNYKAINKEASIYEYNYFYDDNSISVNNYTIYIPHSSENEIYLTSDAMSGLWVTENEFNNLVLQLKIYQISNGDTLYLPTSNYDAKSKWKYKVDKENYSYFKNEGSIRVIDTLYIKKDMFN